MKTCSQQFKNIPVGIISNIIDTIELVATNVSGLYSDLTNVDAFNLYKQEIQEESEKVDALITYDISEDMCYSFEVFINKYVNEAVEKYSLLNKCWELNIND